MRREYNIFHRADWIMIILYLALVLFGWLNIYSAVFDEQHANILDVSQRYGKQLIWIGAAFLLAIIVLSLDPKLFSQFAYFFYIILIFFLIIVIFIGKEVSGSHAWFHIGSIAIQPSEFAKIAVALATAKFLSRRDLNIARSRTWVIAFMIILFPAAIILLQRDTGSALIFLAFVMVFYRFGMNSRLMLFMVLLPVLGVLALLIPKLILLGILTGISLITFLLTRKKLRDFLVIILFLIASSGYILSVDYTFSHILQPHHRQRINVLLGKTSDLKGAGYNVNQSLIAIGSGKFTGKGYLHGTQTKFNFVPEQSTDFIFCTVGEEWGFFGSIAVIALYLGLIIRIIVIAERQRSGFSKIYGYSVACVLFAHVAINIGMTLGLLPVIGIPLPFLSYGGSSLWAFTILLFIFIRQDAYRFELI